MLFDFILRRTLADAKDFIIISLFRQGKRSFQGLGLLIALLFMCPACNTGPSPIVSRFRRKRRLPPKKSCSSNLRYIRPQPQAEFRLRLQKMDTSAFPFLFLAVVVRNIRVVCLIVAVCIRPGLLTIRRSRALRAGLRLRRLIELF